MTEWRPLWDVNREKRFAVRSTVINRVAARSRDVAEGSCDFVGGLVDPTCDGRYCLANNTFCPPRIFEDPKIWETCLTRLEKLKNKKEQAWR
jgi:hypothetical protein